VALNPIPQSGWYVKKMDTKPTLIRAQQENMLKVPHAQISLRKIHENKLQQNNTHQTKASSIYIDSFGKL
jgi:hypothetical protein